MLVPAADAIERPGKALDDKTNMSFESQLVRKIKTQCNDFYSYQGIFVATPSGLLLAGTHHDARDAGLKRDTLAKTLPILREGAIQNSRISRRLTRHLSRHLVPQVNAADGDG